MKSCKLFPLLVSVIILSLLSNNYTFSQIGSNEKKIAQSIAQMKLQLNSLKNKHGFSNDSLRIEVLNRIAALYTKTDKDSSLLYSTRALEYANKLKQKDLMAVSYYNIGNTHNYHNDSINAEENLLEWYNIRKIQGGDKYRWALQGMREFYSKYRQIDKLEKIEEEWISVVDKQFDENKISPWMPKYNHEAIEDYRLSMYPVFNNLIELKEYFIAGKLFSHMVQKCSEYSKWLDPDMPYFKVEGILLLESDTATLSKWYECWFNDLDKYCNNKSFAFETFRLISEKYTGGYRGTSNFPEKYYQKMLGYTNKIGGDSATYKMIEHSLGNYSLTDYETFKLGIFALKICIKSNDIEKQEMHYSSLNDFKYRFSYLDKESLMRIKNLLNANEQSTKDERFKKWCAETIKEIR
jgi:hypothetical protein